MSATVFLPLWSSNGGSIPCADGPDFNPSNVKQIGDIVPGGLAKVYESHRQAVEYGGVKTAPSANWTTYVRYRKF